MSILKRYTDAINNKDEKTMNELLHDNFKFIMHKSGNSLGKADVIKWAMSGDINQDKVRVIYENDEVGIHHSFVTFNDGNVEAVMAVYRYKDGKITSLETGATPMNKQIMFPKKYFDFIFILIMGFGMSLLMTLIITYINTGMDKEYINRFLKAWSVSLPIAIIAALILGAPIKKLVDKITK